MSEELPQGWARAKLNDVVSFALGGDWGKDADDSTDGLARVRVVRGTEFKTWRDQKGARAAERRIKVSSLEKRRLKKGDLVLEVSGGGPNQPVGRTVLIDDEALKRADAPLVCSNFFRLLRLQPEVDSNFISHFLSYAYARGAFNEFQTETTNLRNLNVPDFLEKTEVALAPLAEQRRIVAKLETLLGKVDACQERLAKIPVLLKRFRQSVLAAACSGRLTADWREENTNTENASTRWDIKDAPIEGEDLPDLPATWVYRRLDDISERVSVTHVGPTSQYYCEKSERVLFLRSQNVRPAKLDLTGSLYIRRSFHEANKKSHLKSGDLLIVRVGANRGDTCILPPGLGEVNCANVIFARPFQGITDYLNIYFQTPFCQKNLQDLTTGSAQGVVNTKVVAGVPIAVPPFPEQLEIVRRVEGLFALADQLEVRLAKARGQVDQLTPCLLARAFAGKLVPQDPTDEPAEKLLERIRDQSRSL